MFEDILCMLKTKYHNNIQTRGRGGGSQPLYAKNASFFFGIFWVQNHVYKNMKTQNLHNIAKKYLVNNAVYQHKYLRIFPPTFCGFSNYTYTSFLTL